MAVQMICCQKRSRCRVPADSTDHPRSLSVWTEMERQLQVRGSAGLTESDVVELAWAPSVFAEGCSVTVVQVERELPVHSVLCAVSYRLVALSGSVSEAEVHRLSTRGWMDSLVRMPNLEHLCLVH